MDFGSRKFRKRPILLLAFVVFSAGCFKNPGKQSLPQQSSSVTITPVYVYSDLLSSYLHASGACNGNTQIIFTYYSDVDPSQKSVTADCVVDKVDVQLAITHGDKAQKFTVTMVSLMRTTQSSPLTVPVAYNPPPPLTPGFAVNSGGGKVADSTNSVAQIFSSIGEVVSPATLQDPVSGNKLRTGVEGVNDP